jgi:hypothetical protein
MADIFVSYAKADRGLASKIVAMLQAEGWKVWWDTSLGIGDDFRNEIMTELGRARAVVVIWTDASIKSDWVRSEAGRAQADHKLIPVKLEHLAYKDLPPPFDVLHTENVGEENKIRAAVITQLAKPALEPSALALLTKGFKYELLTWFGIVGGALTLFGNLGTVLKLADWARLLVQNWREWTHAFWVWVFGWLGIHLPPYWTPVLSFLLFGSLLIRDQIVKSAKMVGNRSIADTHQRKSLQLAGRQAMRVILSLFLLVIGGIVWINVIGQLVPKFFPYLWWKYLRFSPGLIVIWIAPPIAIGAMTFARHKLHAAVTIVLIVTFWTIISSDLLMGPPPTHNQPDIEIAGWIAFTLVFLLPLILLLIAPTKSISRRLVFLAIGLILLIALNELSKLGFDLTAPKLQG